MKILAVDTEKRRLGSFGEREAAKFLRKNGYRILRKNYCPDSSEIDIIAEDKETLVFIEVKTRSIEKMSTREPRPASAVTPEKQRSIFDAAIIFLSLFHALCWAIYASCLAISFCWFL